MPKKDWKKISSKIVHKNPWYFVRREEVILPSGKKAQYFITTTGDSVFVVPFDGQNIIFIKQYRYVLKDWTLELPGGGVDDANYENSVRNELVQEVGYLANEFKQVGTFVPLSGMLEERSYVFVAYDLKFVGQELEETEEGAEIIKIDAKKVYDMIESGEIEDGQTISALMLAKRDILSKLKNKNI
jgi:ADP-ribose pyrophosphatase